jgi:hypothetical protein
MSDGKPTKLVCDHGVESYDEPPDEPPTKVPEIIDDLVLNGGSDLQRAEDAWGDNDGPYRFLSPGVRPPMMDPPPGRGVPSAGEGPERPK